MPSMTTDDSSPTSDPTDSTDPTSDPSDAGSSAAATATTTDPSAQATDVVDPTTDAASATSTAANDDDGTTDVERRSVLARQEDSIATDDVDVGDEPDESFSDDGSVSQAGVEPNDSPDDYQDEQSEALSLSKDEQNEDGLTFTTLVDFQKSFMLVPDDDGNIYAGPYSEAPSSALFAQYENIIYGDDEDRVLYYYPDEMNVYNVSRIRLSDEYSIPKTAGSISLSPLDYDTGDDSNPLAYFAVTTTSAEYSLVLCNFANEADSKLLIVNGQDGLDSLANNPNIVYTVTGAIVQDCFPLAVVAGGNGTASAQKQ